MQVNSGYLLSAGPGSDPGGRQIPVCHNSILRYASWPVGRLCVQHLWHERQGCNCLLFAHTLQQTAYRGKPIAFWSTVWKLYFRAQPATLMVFMAETATFFRHVRMIASDAWPGG